MATAKKRSTPKKASSPAPDERMRSFRRYPRSKPFFTFQMTQQTFYWLIISILVLALAVWVLVLTMKVQDIYNKTDAQNMSNDSYMPKKEQ